MTSNFRAIQSVDVVTRSLLSLESLPPGTSWTMLGKSFEARHFAARPARPATDGTTRIVHRSLRHGSVEILQPFPRGLAVASSQVSSLKSQQMQSAAILDAEVNEHLRSEMIRVPSLGIMHLMHRKVRVVEINVCKSVVSLTG
jgi:hypothetical protein